MELVIDSNRKSVGRIDKNAKGNKKSKLHQLAEDMSLQNFEGDLITTVVTRKSDDPVKLVLNPHPLSEYLESDGTEEILTSDTPGVNMAKAGSVHLPKGAERYSYTPSFEYGVIYIPVNRLSMVYQTDDATSDKKVAENRKKMREGTPLDPVQIGYNYDVHDGHHRWIAAQKEGYTHVPCEVVGNDRDKVKKAKAKYRKVWKSLETSYDVLSSDPLALVLDLAKSLNKGKLVRKRVTVKGKDGKTFYRMQWVDPHQDVPGAEHTGKQEETYTHHEEGIKEMEARQSNRFPVMRMSTGEMKIDKYGYHPDKSAIADAIHKYHAGEKLPPVRITPEGKVLNNFEMYEMAKQLGLSHVPVVVVGNTTQKKALEDRLKEQVLVDEEDDDGQTAKVPISHSGTGGATDTKDENLSKELVDSIDTFKQFTVKKYPKEYIMSEAKKQGIKWDSTTKEGKELGGNSGILWMRAHQAIISHMKSGKSFDISPDKKQVDKRMTQDSHDPMHKLFLQVYEKFKGDQQSFMEHMEKEGIAWKKSNDPSINWMKAVTAAKQHLAQGKMLAGVRTRQKEVMAQANLVVSDQIKLQVKALGNKHGKDTVMDRATELGIDFDRFNKKGEELGANSNVLWMRAHVAISMYIAKGNKFQMAGAIEDKQGLTAEIGDSGAVKLNQWSQYALDHTIRNSERDEARTKKYAMDCIKLDRNLDDTGAQEVYDKFMSNARKAKLMVMFDPFEKLPNGVNLLEQMSSDGGLKNNHVLGRGSWDEENMQSNEGDLYDNDYTYHVKKEDRPIYGVVDLFNTGLNTGGGSNYHSGGVAFVMKEDVKNRSTGCNMDSNSIPYGEEGKWTKPLTDPHQLLVDRWYSKWKKPNKADGQRKRAMNAVIEGTTHQDDQRYFESQIHGGMNISRDVDHILIPSSWQTDSKRKEHHTKLQEFAKLHNVSIKYE
jgi:hypothetical protein